MGDGMIGVRGGARRENTTDGKRGRNGGGGYQEGILCARWHFGEDFGGTQGISLRGPNEVINMKGENMGTWWDGSTCWVFYPAFQNFEQGGRVRVTTR